MKNGISFLPTRRSQSGELLITPWTFSLPYGMYYKHVTIVNYSSSGVNKLKASLNDDARVVIDDHYMLIVQATGDGARI